MPVNIIIALLSLLVALVLYCIATVGAFRAKALSKRHVTLVLIGFVFDVLATSMMAISAGGLVNDLHTYIALVAMAGMALSGLVGLWALSQKRDAVLATIARWMPLPLALWIFVFVWGMATRGPST